MSTWQRARNIRRVCGFVLAIFMIGGIIALFRGMIETAIPGWAFYRWG